MQTRLHRPLALSAAFVALAMSGGPQLGAATAPYSNNFSDTGANTAFTTETTDSEWTLNNGSYRNTFSNSSITPTSASLSVTGTAGGNFVIETQFTIQQMPTSINSNGATLGLGVLSASTTFAGASTGSSYYLADILYGNNSSTDVGRLRILSLGDAGGFNATGNGLADDNAGANFALTVGTTYTLRFTGTYNNGTLSMTFGLYNDTGTTQIGTSATATDTSPLTGDSFGYRNRIGIGSGASIIDFDNFSVTTSAVPEPSTFALVGGIAALGFAATRRQSR